MAYSTIEPFGAWRDNFHTATIAAILANTHRGNRPPVSFDDFMFKDAHTSKKERVQQLMAQFRAKADNGRQ